MKKFQAAERFLISEAVLTLEKWPDGTNVRDYLSHKYGYGFRSGRFRIIFDVGLFLSIVMIEEVKKHDEDTC